MRKDANLYQPDENSGGYEYIGAYYDFPIKGAELKRKKIIWLALSALALLAYLGAGLLDVRVTRAAYVVIPYALSLPPLGYGLAGALALIGMGERLTVPQWKRGARRLLRASAGATVLLTLTFLGAGICMARTGAAELGFPACALLAALFSGGKLRLSAGCRARKDERSANAG